MSAHTWGSLDDTSATALMEEALAAATGEGVTFADVRLVEAEEERLYTDLRGELDERREHNPAGVDEQHELEVRHRVPCQERRHGGRHQQHLHQHLRALLPLPIHLQMHKKRKKRVPSDCA